MTHEYKCPDCGRMVSPTPFIGRVPPDATEITRKFACVCHTVFLVNIEINQLSLTDFDSETVETSAQRTSSTPITLY